MALLVFQNVFRHSTHVAKVKWLYVQSRNMKRGNNAMELGHELHAMSVASLRLYHRF